MKLEKVVAYRGYFLSERPYEPRTVLPNKAMAEQLLDLLTDTDYTKDFIVKSPSGVKYRLWNCYDPDDSHIDESLFEDEEKFSFTIDDALSHYGKLVKNKL